jgi:phenylalanine-4-hydroxylase
METEGKSTGYASHYSSKQGWTRGNLDFYTVKPHVFTEEEHDIWRHLYKRQSGILKGRAIAQFMDSLSTLGINADRISSFDEVNEILMKRSGWQVVPVPGLIPDEPFFDLLANRRFPIGNFIRTKEQLDYIQEPDVFHDLFGHIPILADPTFANYIEAYGHGGFKASQLGVSAKIIRLYWYTVEFGLIQEKDGIRIYGAGILSSPTESVFALESKSPHRIKFNLRRLLQTRFNIDDFQDIYFVIDDFDQLFRETEGQDFTPIYAELKGKPLYQPGVLADSDVMLHTGTGEYAIEAAKRRTARAAASK